MKVYLNNPPMSRAMDRVTKALKIYAPQSVKIASTKEDADIELLHVIGYDDTVEYLSKMPSGRKYGIIQYCVKSTQAPQVERWLDIWRNAEVVWSYYDLVQMMAEEGTFIGQSALSRFYISPLGVDTEVFRSWPTAKKFAICTSGYVPETEAVLEAMAACEQTGRRMFHLGPDDKRFKKHVVHQLLGINDKVLAQQYSLCNYVAGLRRVEGFELPAAEGLICGARPVMFDKPHYRKWFEDFAEFIPEGTFEEVTSALAELFQKENEVTQEEIEFAKLRFDWQKIASGFWATLGNPKKIYPVAPRVRPEVPRRLLWVGDAVVSSGFAKSTHGVLDNIKNHWDVHVLGLNYFGDPHGYDYPIYPCRTVERPNADFFGIDRIAELVHKIRPHVIVVQNDPWNIPRYLKAAGNCPVIGFLAVDGKNCRGSWLNGLRAAIFWTEFGFNEARAGGFTGLGAVIPLGVDLETFYPVDRLEARMSLPFKEADLERLKDAFIVGTVNRNQQRKRLDLTLSFFAEWVRNRNINDAYLFMHVAPTGDQGYDLSQLAEYYGVNNQVVIIEPNIGMGTSVERLRNTYNTFDVLLSTSQGEGWHLPTMEAMACRVACAVPNHSAFTEWPLDGVLRIPLSGEIECTPNFVNTIGFTPSRQSTIEALQLLYEDEDYREKLATRGWARVQDPMFRWENIGEMFLQVLDQALRVEAVAAAG